MRHFNDAPFAFCGYSAGGVLGWRIAAKLALSANGLSPLALFSVVSPTSPKWATEWMAERPGELKELLAGRNVIGYKKAYEQILQDMIVDCDFIMDMGGFPGDLLSPAPRKLSIPLVAFGGDADPLVPKEVTEGWGALTAGPFSHYILPGDHLLMVDDANIVEITRRIVLHLESTLKTSSRV